MSKYQEKEQQQNRPECTQRSHDDGHHFHAAAEEVPSVFSYRNDMILPSPLSGIKLANEYLDALLSINQWCQTEHVLVGHIKFQLKAGEHSCWASSTGENISTRKTVKWDTQWVERCTLRFTAIVFQTTQLKLEAAVAARMPRPGQAGKFRYS